MFYRADIIHREQTGWLGRQDSNLCIRNRARLGLPLSCGAKSGSRSCARLQQARTRSALSARHDSSEGSGTQIPDAEVRILPPHAYRRETRIWIHAYVVCHPHLTAIAERQAKAMAESGIMDHSVAGSFSSRISGAHTGGAAENIAAGTRTWAETFRSWQKSPGHNANLLQARADSVGVAVARNDQTRYKTYWAMAIADKSPKKKDRKVAAQEKNVERNESSVNSENPLTTVKNFVCKYLC